MKTKRKNKRGRMASVICRLFGILILVAVIGMLVPVTVPRFMGYEIFNIISGSMEPEIPVGSIVYVKPADLYTISGDDIIAFNSHGSVVVHRVVTNHLVEENFITKGDANEKEDIEPVPYASVYGPVVKHYPVIGQLMMIMSNTLGKVLLLCLILSGVLLNIIAGRLQEE